MTSQRETAAPGGTGTLTHGAQVLRYRLDGDDADAPWLVFSNSLLTDLTVWDDQMAALAASYRILRYDQRGHGGSAVPAAPASFDQLGGDVLALLDHLGIGRCTFVGLSMGVPTALWLARYHPQRIARLVLVDGQAQTADSGAAAWEERIAFARDKGMEALAEATLGRWFAPAFMAGPGGARMWQMVTATPLGGFVACARALQSYAFADVLPGIAVPALLVAGARDGAMPRTMAAMSEIIPGAVMREIPDAGHIPPVEQAEAFTAILLSFLAETDEKIKSTDY